MASASKKIVPYSDVFAHKDLREDVFGERNIHQHISKHLDLRSRLRLATADKTYWNMMQPQDDPLSFPKPTRRATVETSLNNALRNPFIQNFMGTYLSKEDRLKLTSITPQTRRGGALIRFTNNSLRRRKRNLDKLVDGMDKLKIKECLRADVKDEPTKRTAAIRRAALYRQKIDREGHQKQQPIRYLQDNDEAVYI